MTIHPTMTPGLCSVTFRQFGTAAVVELAAAAGLAGIEWGADVHVPVGDLTAARVARQLTTEAGLAVTSYGSYLTADRRSRERLEPVLATAAALGADLVRIWCPFGVEPGAPASDRSKVAGVLAGWTERAAADGITLYLEFHGGTLTASAPSARALLEEVGDGRLRCGWQARYWDVPPTDRLDPADELALLEPWLAHVHVYEWEHDTTRLPLEAGHGSWPAVLAQASRTDPGPVRRYALLEFVTDDDPAALGTDAATLIRWLAQIQAQEVAT